MRNAVMSSMKKEMKLILALRYVLQQMAITK